MDKNPSYSTNPGNATKDKIFLLSITEANKYFSSDEARKCASTAHTVAQGVDTNSKYILDGKGVCVWWLRSPGLSQNFAANIYYGGDIYSNGYSIIYDGVATRPAMWVEIF